MSYQVQTVSEKNSRLLQKMKDLLEQEGISLDQNLDYRCVVVNSEDEVVATGSCFKHTLRCLAVSKQHQGEGLLNLVVTHLIQFQFQRANTHLFVYTKVETSGFFKDLGFFELATISDKLVFLENRREGFSQYLEGLWKESASKTELITENDTVGAVVMNANPFTKGHLALLEKASSETSILHVFLVSEDVSFVPFSVRKRLIMEGSSHLSNIIFHDTMDYLISSATFPSYFLKDATLVAESQAHLDMVMFTQIAKKLDISRRFVGEEPQSQVTALYSEVMQAKLSENGIEVVVMPRVDFEGQVISASTVREGLKQENWPLVEQMLPATSVDFFRSSEGQTIIQSLKDASCVSHH